ncbi:MAG TPA: DUF4333 domain-containing protein [Mycobacterium sp.]|nr:DUF4333 domain-containing protein [Mycobacterium sp.]
MTGPQGYDPTQPWQPQPPGQGEGQQDPDQQWQPPAYTPQQYPQYQEPTGSYPSAPQYPAAPGYPQPEQYGQQPTQFGQPTQYGQYPQQPGQYGQPTQYGQYGQYGPPGQYGQYPPQPGQYGQSAPAGKRPSTVIGTVSAAFLGILVLVVLVLGFWKPGFFVTTKLDVSKAQEGVQQILTDQTNGYGAKNVKDVKCNDGQNPVVKQGDTFNCEVSIDGTKRQVTVTFRDNSGTYEVGRPK